RPTHKSSTTTPSPTSKFLWPCPCRPSPPTATRTCSLKPGDAMSPALPTSPTPTCAACPCRRRWRPARVCRRRIRTRRCRCTARAAGSARNSAATTTTTTRACRSISCRMRTVRPGMGSASRGDPWVGGTGRVGTRVRARMMGVAADGGRGSA
ncbi:hypothetical protein LTR16_010541, partial [Cryomyces antarcticus]